MRCTGGNPFEIWKFLSHRAANKILNELEKQERSDMAELARADVKLKKILEAAEE